MKKEMKKRMKESKARNETAVNEKEKLFHVLTDLLFTFDQVCRDNNLTYSIFGGTLLGAVRHHGFIPWDDDIDVTMPRTDYDKLMRLSNSLFDYPYFLQNPITDHGYHKGFARLRNSETTEIAVIDAAFDCNHGAFIDIFPMDAVPDDKKEFDKLTRKMSRQVKMLHFAGRYSGGVGTLGLKNKKKIAYYILLPLYKTGIISSQKLFDNLNKTASKYNGNKTTRIGIISYCFQNERFIYNRSDYDTGYMDMGFENIKVKAPKEYDSILRKSYKDYMIPIHEKTNHGETIYDMDIPFADYVKQNKDRLIKLWLSTR